MNTVIARNVFVTLAYVYERIKERKKEEAHLCILIAYLKLNTIIAGNVLVTLAYVYERIKERKKERTKKHTFVL